MNRREVLFAGFGGTVGLLANQVDAQEGKADAPLPGAIPLKIGEALDIYVQSTPVKVGKEDLHIVSVGRGTFYLDKESRLTGRLKAAVAQYAKTVYWISAAVFDLKGKLLGAAAHREEVQYIRLGQAPTIFREIDLDFGISKAYSGAKFLAVSVSEPEEPKPG